jgi:large subunit ribosomal protein L35
MPKMKSNRSAMKRFRKTGTGKVRRNQAYHGHLFTAKSPKRKRKLRMSTLVCKADTPRVKRMISGK